MSVVNTVIFGAMPFGSLLAGVIGERMAVGAGFSPQSGLAVQAGVSILALVLVGAGLCMIVFRTPEIDGISHGEPGFERRPGLRSGITAHRHRPGADRGLEPETAPG